MLLTPEEATAVRSSSIAASAAQQKHGHHTHCYHTHDHHRMMMMTDDQGFIARPFTRGIRWYQQRGTEGKCFICGSGKWNERWLKETHRTSLMQTYIVRGRSVSTRMAEMKWKGSESGLDGETGQWGWKEIEEIGHKIWKETERGNYHHVESDWGDLCHNELAARVNGIIRQVELWQVYFCVGGMKRETREMW